MNEKLTLNSPVLYFAIAIEDCHIDEDLKSDDPEIVKQAQDALNDIMAIELAGIEEIKKIVGCFYTEGHGYSDELICKVYPTNIEELKNVWNALSSGFGGEDTLYLDQYVNASEFILYPNGLREDSYGVSVIASTGETIDDFIEQFESQLETTI